MADPGDQDKIFLVKPKQQSLSVHVSDRPSYSNREASAIRSSSHENNPVAHEEQFACTQEGAIGDDSSSQVSPLSSSLGDAGSKYSTRPIFIPPSTFSTIFTDVSNEGWGAHLRDCTARGVWSLSESKLPIDFVELKEVVLAY